MNQKEEQIGFWLKQLVKSIIKVSVDTERLFSDVAEQEYRRFLLDLPKETKPPSIKGLIVAGGKLLVERVNGVHTQYELWSLFNEVMKEYVPDYISQEQEEYVSGLNGQKVEMPLLF